MTSHPRFHALFYAQIGSYVYPHGDRILASIHNIISSFLFKPLEASDKKEVNLEISEVTKDHLGAYILTAKNEYGEKSVTLELKKASATPKPKPKPVESKGQQGGVEGRSLNTYSGHS